MLVQCHPANHAPTLPPIRIQIRAIPYSATVLCRSSTVSSVATVHCEFIHTRFHRQDTFDEEYIGW